MCQLNRAARARPDSQSLALVQPREVEVLEITRHPGWTPEQQRKIDAYASQPELFGSQDRTPLEAPWLSGRKLFDAADLVLRRKVKHPHQQPDAAYDSRASWINELGNVVKCDSSRTRTMRIS